MNFEITSTPKLESYWVIPGRFRAGEYPGAILDVEAREKLRWLLAQQINYFLDLTEDGEYDLKPYLNLLMDEASLCKREVIHTRIPIYDLTTPSGDQMVEILDTIDTALSDNRNIYLHCYGGKGRTGVVVGCYLTRHGTSGSDALELIKKLRSNLSGSFEQSPETALQKRMVLEWTVGK